MTPYSTISQTTNSNSEVTAVRYTPKLDLWKSSLRVFVLVGLADDARRLWLDASVRARLISPRCLACVTS